MLTERDNEILQALSHRIRMLTADQIASTWWAESSVETAKRRLDGLVRDGWLQRSRCAAHPLLDLSEPVFSWVPGTAPPAFHALAYKLQKRWNRSIRPTTIYHISRKTAAQRAGSGHNIKHRFQITHDLHVAQIYLLTLRRCPERARAWISEDKLAPSRVHQKLPDAIIRLPAGDLVVEFGGAYRPERLLRIHEDCVGRGIAYELW